VTFVKVASEDDLWEGEMLACAAEGARVVLIKGAGYLVAYEDRCPHLGARLSEGALAGHVLTCRAHLWQYDARTGCGINPEAARLRAFPTKVEQGALWVDPRAGGGA
jgi:toluene monooxygenase system ferredoxin subunit